MILNTVRLAALGAVAGVITGTLTRSFIPSESSANHPKDNPHDHIGSIHSFEQEDFCVDVVGSSMDFGSAYGRISGTLMAANPAEDWDRLDGSSDGNKLAFAATGPTPCDANPNSLQIELEYSVSDAGCGEETSCASPQGFPYYDPVSDQEEWHKYRVDFLTSHINQADPGPGQPKPWWHMINHETGHMLGLSDPHCVADPVNPGNDWRCPPGWLRECGAEAIKETYGLPNSAMHDQGYGCAQSYPWPTTNDWSSALALMGTQQGPAGPSGKGWAFW